MTGKSCHGRRFEAVQYNEDTMLAFTKVDVKMESFKVIVKPAKTPAVARVKPFPTIVDKTFPKTGFTTIRNGDPMTWKALNRLLVGISVYVDPVAY